MFSLTYWCFLVLLVLVAGVDGNNDESSDVNLLMYGDGDGDSYGYEYGSIVGVNDNNDDADIYLPSKRRYPTFEYCCCSGVPQGFVCDPTYGITYPNLCQAKCNSADPSVIKPGKCPPRPKRRLVVRASTTAIFFPTFLRIRVVVSFSITGGGLNRRTAGQDINAVAFSASAGLQQKLQGCVVATAHSFSVAARIGVNQALAYAEAGITVFTDDDDDDEDATSSSSSGPPPTEWEFKGFYNKCCCVGQKIKRVCNKQRTIVYPNQCQAECDGVFDSVDCEPPKNRVLSIKTRAHATFIKGVVRATATVTIKISVNGVESSVTRSSTVTDNSLATTPILNQNAANNKLLRIGEFITGQAAAQAFIRGFASFGAIGRFITVAVNLP